MAELSFPFDAANEHGGSAVVSQIQWQQMATAWGGDRIDFPLGNGTYTGSDLPFTASTSGRQVTVYAGSAWVGGFYYKLSGSKAFTTDVNDTGRTRKDLIVIRADMAKSAVTMELRKGLTSLQAKEPMPIRQVGGIWEMPLFAVDVPANNGNISVSRRAPFYMPPPVALPWNAVEAAGLLPEGTLSYDMDNNNTGGQWEAFNGLDGYVTTRHLGRSRGYTPSVLNVSAVASSYRSGRWRWIAPNTYWFQATINNKTDKGALTTGSNWRAGISLPVTCNKSSIQTVHGYLSNPDRRDGMPNMLSVTATTHPGSTSLYLHAPNSKTPTEGLDGLNGFPARSTFSISGVIEANEFNE